MKQVVVSGSFDDIRSHHVRFLEEAAKFGRLHVLLWSDALIVAQTGQPPKFSEAERLYFVGAIRYPDRVTLISGAGDVLAAVAGLAPQVWVMREVEVSTERRAFCTANDIELVALSHRKLAGFPLMGVDSTGDLNRKVVVTGCYDWFHSGHVRFFEETSELGDLYVVAGSDANVRLLKGAGRPLIPEDERRYMVQSIRFVKQALISSGQGWMDAEPEIAKIKPDMYAVNEDGDVPEKRAFCQEHGIDYVVLKRTPKLGLSQRSSTKLRGF